MRNNEILRDELKEWITYPEGKVLLVDDVKVNLQVAKGMLEPYELQVDLVQSGEDALAVIKKDAYDLIFMDHMMPGMDGIEATRCLKTMEQGSYGHIPVIALSANTAVGAKEQFLEYGFDDFLSKPIDGRKLDAILQKWIPEEKRKVSGRKTDKKEESEEIFIKGVDTGAGLHNMGGKRKIYDSILKSFCTEVLEIGLSLEQYIDTDINMFCTTVHGVKGGSRNIGAFVLGDASEQLEEAARGGHMDVIKENWDAYRALLHETVNEIQVYLDYEEMAAKPCDIKGKTENFRKELEGLRDAFGEYDMDKMECSLQKIKWSAKLEQEKALAKQLEELVEQLEYETGVALIDSYLK